ncbi:2OG-Fe(II) oxygenase [Streptomyces sp. NPDC040724]|uniref:2OG-Fe(II) oxygenase n=1 Tax=Streptomyces sp. NPDC040724 TaxID=3155612 RepID=UPI0033C4E60E
MAESRAADALEHVVGALRGTTLREDPWPHCYLPNALPASMAEAIETSFKRFDLASVEGVNRDKTYRMRTRRLDPGATGGLPSPAWRHLVEALSHDRYRAAVAGLTGVALDDTDLSLDLWEYRDGDWLAPHVDKPEKLVTQLFYFSESWHPEAGGHLLVLDGGDSDRPVERLRPTTGASALLVRSETSWHAVELSRGAGASRCSIAATFWTRGSAPAPRQES